MYIYIYSMHFSGASLIAQLVKNPPEMRYSGLENSMDYIVHGVTNNQTHLGLTTS